MADQFDSPVDIAGEDMGRPGLGQMAAAVGTALLLLGLFNAHALAAWADALPPGPLAERILPVAQGLAARMAPLDAPRAALHDRWEAAKAARWPGQPPEPQ